MSIVLISMTLLHKYSDATVILHQKNGPSGSSVEVGKSALRHVLPSGDRRGSVVRAASGRTRP